MEPKISVIIPVYNVEKYIQKCLDSIINQTYTNTEIICIDDGSTDNSLEILNNYAKNDDRFVIITQKNQGQGVARNNAIKIAKGEYIICVDSDDWIESDSLEKLYNFAAEKNADVVRFDYKLIYENAKNTQEVLFDDEIKKDYGFAIENKEAYNYKMFMGKKLGVMRRLGLATCNYFIKRDFINRFDIKFAPSRLGEDHLFALGILFCAKEIYYLKETFYCYRMREGSAIHSKTKEVFLTFDNIEKIREFLIKNSLYDELKYEFFAYAEMLLRNHSASAPKESSKEYEKLCREFIDKNEEYKKWLMEQIETKRFEKQHQKKFIEKVFSVRNDRTSGIRCKVITIFGIKVKI